MSTTIQVWHIEQGGGLTPINSSLAESGRDEPHDFEGWIAAHPEVLSADLKIIGRQVRVSTGGELDLLGIDSAGSLVIIELKRDRLPREVLAQALESAAAVAQWEPARIAEECLRYTGKSLEDFLAEHFAQTSLEELDLNGTQRIILAGFRIDASLQTMIEWLFERYNVPINAIALKYIRTVSGDEILARTAIITEEMERQNSHRRRFTIPMSEDPGTYDEATLKSKLTQYLSQDMKTARAIKEIILPLALKHGTLTRQTIKEELVARGFAPDIKSSFIMVANISTQFGMAKNDFLRQIVEYSYPTNPWEKDNYQIREQYLKLVQELVTHPR